MYTQTTDVSLFFVAKDALTFVAGNNRLLIPSNVRNSCILMRMYTRTGTRKPRAKEMQTTPRESKECCWKMCSNRVPFSRNSSTFGTIHHLQFYVITCITNHLLQLMWADPARTALVCSGARMELARKDDKLNVKKCTSNTRYI